MARLAGRSAIVTGGAKGIGRHYSRALAAEGARVMIADIADGRELAQELASAHGANSVASSVTDVSDERAVVALIAATMERFGRIDILVNNAALYAPLQEQKCTEIDAAVWDQVMAVNLRGPFLMVKHVAPRMQAQGYGKIINIGSGTAFRGIPWMLHYVTTKGGIMAMTRALARELGEHGIRVNTLAPGAIATDFGGGAVRDNAELNRFVASVTALGRAGEPEDIGGAAAALMRPGAGWITGQRIEASGGMFL